jgi:hypothetical protein
MHKYAGGSGFKSLRTFNYAILGKQSWKLLTSLVNLITKLLKAKYFPKSNFLSSSIGHNPSYVWQNIWSAKFIFFLTVKHSFKLTKVNQYKQQQLRVLGHIPPKNENHNVLLFQLDSEQQHFYIFE